MAIYRVSLSVRRDQGPAVRTKTRDNQANTDPNVK